MKKYLKRTGLCNGFTFVMSMYAVRALRKLMSMFSKGNCNVFDWFLKFLIFIRIMLFTGGT